MPGTCTSSGSPGESHWAPTDLGVTVSRHPALLDQVPSVRGDPLPLGEQDGRPFLQPGPPALANILWDRSRLYFRQAQRFM